MGSMKTSPLVILFVLLEVVGCFGEPKVCEAGAYRFVTTSVECAATSAWVNRPEVQEKICDPAETTYSGVHLSLDLAEAVECQQIAWSFEGDQFTVAGLDPSIIWSTYHLEVIGYGLYGDGYVYATEAGNRGRMCRCWVTAEEE